MSIGERIRKIRTLRGMTQKELGRALGFPERSADVRIAQYETGTRTPKEDLIDQLANVLQVKPQALATPDTDTYIGLMEQLFDLEDSYGLHIDTLNDELVLRLDKTVSAYPQLLDLFTEWQKARDTLQDDPSPNAYLDWKLNYPHTK